MKQACTLVVGASVSGLALAASLKKKRIDYLIIEQEAQVAMPWCNHYDRLHLHTNKSLSNLPFKKFDRKIPRHPSRQKVVDYLDDYPVTKIMPMDVQNLPDYISPKQGFVSVLKSSCKWEVTYALKKFIKIEFTLFADPAGSIPSWLTNMFSIYGPLETFKKLKIQLRKPEYAN